MNRLFFVLAILFSTNVYSANLTLPHHLMCETPWYNFKIDAPEMNNKYSLGIPTNEPFARYTSCKEVE